MKINQSSIDSRIEQVCIQKRCPMCYWQMWSCIFTKLISNVHSNVNILDMNHSSVTNLNRKYAEQAVLFTASLKNFVLGQ